MSRGLSSEDINVVAPLLSPARAAHFFGAKYILSSSILRQAKEPTEALCPTTPRIPAVLYAGLLGQGSGNAIVDVLYGDVNPSGKLSHTIAKKRESDNPTSVFETENSAFKEGFYVNHRWFDAKNIEHRFPFGHGSSYTTFNYGDVSAKVTNSSALSSKYPTETLNDPIQIITTVKYTGSLQGREMASCM
ncbi:hypothetical protein N7532_006834 [Penicillium argentinense]|uniref:beta-glucosidase n=1 Tax=Penicillium argentinense TaxID=1131581 RepID=A0A9W9FGK1_9EURO|nr:uncharacterized protein N7532_006834 [Penicillium argentinense]KAJ5099833.1 hypothetical protein N7532_006834 [Penicillium argentinense]